MKNRVIGLLVAVTVILSGAAGFGGAYLAGFLSGGPPAAYEDYEYARPPGQANAPVEQDETPGAGPDLFSAANANVDNMDGGNSWVSSASIKTAPTELTVPEIAAKTSNTVVEIYTEAVVGGGRMRQFVTEGAGSGVLITSDGYIVTNNHVIEGARKITVHLSSGVEYDAVLIGRDVETDLAVIKIEAKNLPSAKWGDSNSLSVGELAVAIGNPLGKLGGTVTEGIISALSRNIEIDGQMMTLLQTSAAVNPGNSGGGLFDCYGELIGIVNAKSSGADIEGIGFAIPANLAKGVAEDLIRHGYVPGRIDFGAALIDVLDPMTAMMYRVSTTGVYVSQAEPDSALKAGDRIISINGHEIGSSADISALLDASEVGDVLKITVSRNGSTLSVEHILKQLV